MNNGSDVPFSPILNFYCLQKAAKFTIYPDKKPVLVETDLLSVIIKVFWPGF